MRRKLLIVGGIALLAATLTTVFFYNLLSDQLKQPEESEVVRLVVASRDLPRGARLRPEMLRVVSIPRLEAPSDAFLDAGELNDRILVEPVKAGEPLTSADLPAGGGQGLASAIPPGMRAVSVHVDDYAGVNGILETGDRVDVLVANAVRSPGRPDISMRTLLQNVAVLTSDLEVSDNRRANGSPNVTLLVEAAQAADLSLADHAGVIRLALRNPADADRVEGGPLASADIVGDTPRGAAPRVRTFTPSPAPRPSPRTETPAPEADAAKPKAPTPQPTPAESGTVLLTMRFAGLGDVALQRLVEGLEERSQAAPVIVSAFRPGWDVRQEFQALRRAGHLQVFSEPALVALESRPAAFEEASATPAVGAADTELDRVGVRAELTPELLGAGRLRMHIAAAATLPDTKNLAQVGGASLPRLALRKAECEIEIVDGQSFWIRGLIDRPGAWDFLRRLFPKRPLEQNGHDELVILVTPQVLSGESTAISALLED